MVEFLLSGMLTCADGKWILDGIQSSDISARVRADLVFEVLQVMPDNCEESQYRGEGRP